MLHYVFTLKVHGHKRSLDTQDLFMMLKVGWTAMEMRCAQGGYRCVYGGPSSGKFKSTPRRREKEAFLSTSMSIYMSTC